MKGFFLTKSLKFRLSTLILNLSRFSVKKQQTYKNKRENRRDNAEFRAKKPILRELCRKIKQPPKAKRTKKKDKAQKGEIEKTPYTWEKHK